MQWLASSALLTSMIWLVYVPNRMLTLGLMRTMGNPSDSDPPLAAWAQRAIASHRNAVENLVVFGLLLLAAQVLGKSGELTFIAAKVYFFARVAHLIFYVAGIPVLRTLAFATGWICQTVVALVVFGWGGI